MEILIGLIIIAQNMQNLSDDWNTPIKTVSFVISGVGMGRLLSYLLTGYLADRLSRKLFIYIGMGCYLIWSQRPPSTSLTAVPSSPASPMLHLTPALIRRSSKSTTAMAGQLSF